MKNKTQKILRACVVQGGKVIEEQRLKSRQPLTIGNSPHNTFVLVAPGVPKSHSLFIHRSGGAYELVFTEAMRGKVSKLGGGAPVDFSTLKAKGIAKKRGNAYHLRLTHQHRGKVIIGDATIIFQFVVPPPAPPRPRLPEAARGSIWKSIDWPYAAALIAVFVIEAPFIVSFQYMDKPEQLTLDSIDSRWANLIVPEYKAKPKKVEAPKDGKSGQAKKAKEKVAKDKPSEEKAAAKKAARRKGIQEKIQGKGILAILGTVGTGSSGGAVADVFGSGGFGDLDSAFDGIGGVGLATAGSGRTTRGGGTGSAAGIGSLATEGGGNVGLGKKGERRVGAVKTSAPEVDGSLDSAAITRVVRTRMRSIQDCYQRELKRDPELAGKIEIEFTIDENGRVEEALVASNGMGSDGVGRCIVGRIRRWRFPKPDGGSVTVNYPFIFTAAG